MNGISFVIPFPSFLDYVLGSMALLFMGISWYYFFRFYVKVKREKNEPASSFPPVSIVIAAKNELPNLQQFLPLWLEQDYPEFEVIITDDGSTDGTAEWMAPLVLENPKLKYVHLDAEYVKMHGKKIALTLGFKAARYGHFLLTDADCKPGSKYWTRTMAAPFTRGAEVVLGYSPLHAGKGFLGRLIRFETLLTALNYLGFALAGKPYMGVGRNLAYKKELFYRHKGFSSHNHISGGDDDLFVNMAANSHNTKVVVDPQAHTLSVPHTRFTSWYKQKTRHYSVAKFYKPVHRFLLTIYAISQFLFYPLFIGAMLLSDWRIALGFFSVRMIIQSVVYYKSMKKLNEKDLFAWYLFFDIAQFLFYIIFSTAILKRPKAVWK